MKGNFVPILLAKRRSTIIRKDKVWLQGNVRKEKRNTLKTLVLIPH